MDDLDDSWRNCINPITCMVRKAAPRIEVTISNCRYLGIFRCLNDVNAKCIVKLLTRMVAVEIQNMEGISSINQFAWLLFTM